MPPPYSNQTLSLRDPHTGVEVLTTIPSQVTITDTTEQYHAAYEPGTVIVPTYTVTINADPRALKLAAQRLFIMAHEAEQQKDLQKYSYNVTF